MLDEGTTLVPRGIGDVGNLSERRLRTSRKCLPGVCPRPGKLHAQVCQRKGRSVHYLRALLLPHILGAPHQPRQDRQSTLEPDLRPFHRKNFARRVLLVLFFAILKELFPQLLSSTEVSSKESRSEREKMFGRRRACAIISLSPRYFSSIII
jgi:hypothetical protein